MVRRLRLPGVCLAVQPAREPTDQPSSARRVLRVLAIAAGGLCLLVVLLLVALQSGPARRLAVSRVTSMLASRQIELRTGDLRYNLFRLAIDARDLQLRSAGAPNLPTFATVG